MTLDEAMEWCEEALLDALDVRSTLRMVDGLPGWIAGYFESEAARQTLLEMLTEVRIQRGRRRHASG
ncbi:MAG: hypothetical protein U5O39_12805 [Gammaproteobacteria bacterium]|nr:hypothetical protein [Gammaproteobacteria bacterium]